MTKDEATKILAVVTAAYPTYYKDTSIEAAKGIIAVWAVQFANIPVDIVFMAVNKHINSSKYPPTICEVKEKISSLHWDAYTALNTPGGKASEEIQRIYELTKAFKFSKSEPSLREMLIHSQQYLLEEAR